ncbi:MAG TPA: rhomboid family intramembrane serine protease [Vicinamibacteria bacterium]|nr:rhomboid family intramembrane serine protease [Vicinamibacteria bacterium]
MRSARALSGNFNVLGGRVPVVVALLIGLTFGGSILGAVSVRSGLPLLHGAALFPDRVLAGEVWRLLTWVFFETDPLSLIFACLGLWWFGRDLTGAWGPVRFLAVYVGLAVATAGVTCLLALLLSPGLAGLVAVGPWALVTALIVAWALLYPHQDVLVYFVLPLRGQTLIYATVGGTVLFAIFYGVDRFLPHFIAQGLMWLYVRQSLRRLWLKFRFALQQRSSRRRSPYIRPVGRSDRSEPPRWLH